MEQGAQHSVPLEHVSTAHQNTWYRLSFVSDRKLDERLRALARQEHGVTAELLAHVTEVDARRLCGGMAEGTTFNYSVHVLGFSEDEACKRIRVARTARQYPVIYDLVARGELGQTAVSRLAPLLSRENHGELLGGAPVDGRGSAQQRLLGGAPDDGAVSLRSVACGPSSETDAAAGGPSTGFKTDAPSDTVGHALLDAGQDLDARPMVGAVCGLPQYTPMRRGNRSSVTPLAPDRYRVRRAVVERNGEQCTFVGPDGRRCQERAFLELHHRENYAWGGPATVENLTLLCKIHNQHLAIRDLGDKARRPSRRRRK